MPAEMTIASVWFGEGKTGNVSFTADPDKKIKVWANAPFREALKVGATAVAGFETIPAKGDFPEQKFLKSWGGVSMPEKQRGGGGRPSKSPEEILAEQKNIHASVALQTAKEFVLGLGDNKLQDAGQVIGVGERFYNAMREWVK